MFGIGVFWESIMGDGTPKNLNGKVFNFQDQEMQKPYPIE